MSIGSDRCTTGIHFFQLQTLARFGSCSHGGDMHIRMGRYFVCIRVRCRMTSSGVRSSRCMRISFFSCRFFSGFLNGLFLFRCRLSRCLCRCICGYLGILSWFGISLFRLGGRLCVRWFSFSGFRLRWFRIGRLGFSGFRRRSRFRGRSVIVMLSIVSIRT